MRRINAFDTAVVIFVGLAIAGFGLAKAGHAGVDQVIEGKHKVAIDVYLIGLKTLDTDLFKVGDETSITIRNQPVEPPMKILKVDHWQHKASFLAPDAKSALAFPDPAVPLAHDYIVTITDVAEQTKDGYVIRGNKIKVGNQVELEGFKYRTQGVVVDIKNVDDSSDSNATKVPETTEEAK